MKEIKEKIGSGSKSATKMIPSSPMQNIHRKIKNPTLHTYSSSFCPTTKNYNGHRLPMTMSCSIVGASSNIDNTVEPIFGSSSFHALNDALLRHNGLINLHQRVVT